MAQPDESMLWLFDSVTQFLKGPDWAVPVWDFIDENCIIFDSEEENKLAYHDSFNLFREMVEGLLGMHLTDMGCSMDAFAELCATYGTTDVGKEVLEQILAVDDFLSFKTMMVKRNMELELESLRALQELTDKVEGGETEQEPDADEDDFEAQLKVRMPITMRPRARAFSHPPPARSLPQQALELSIQEAMANGVSTGVDRAELERKEDEKEEADLKMAMAMSLQLEEERERMENEGREAPMPLAPSNPSPPPPEPPAAVAQSRITPMAAPPPAMAPVRPPAGGPLGALPPMPGRAGAAPRAPPQERTPTQIAAAEMAQRVSAEAAAVREAAIREKEEREAEQARHADSVSASEMRARQEHLKKQRDLILAQRKKARDAAAAAAPSPPPPAAPPIVGGNATNAPQMASSSAHRGAGYTSGEPVADAQRARLSVALASNMKASLLGEDATTLDLQQRIESHHRKIDLELTKAQLRAEVERDRAMGS